LASPRDRTGQKKKKNSAMKKEPTKGRGTKKNKKLKGGGPARMTSLQKKIITTQGSKGRLSDLSPILGLAQRTHAQRKKVRTYP